MDFRPDQQAEEEAKSRAFSNFIDRTVAEARERLAQSGEKPIPILLGRDSTGTIRSIIPMGRVPSEGSETSDED